MSGVHKELGGALYHKRLWDDGKNNFFLRTNINWDVNDLRDKSYPLNYSRKKNLDTSIKCLSSWKFYDHKNCKRNFNYALTT